MKKAYLRKQGFTLIELLIVIGVMSVLATVVFVILNPVARLQDSRNARRWSDINALISAVKLSQSDKRDWIASIKDDAIDDKFYQIGTAGPDPNCALACQAVILEGQCVDFTELVDTGYLPKVPYDPIGSGAAPTFTHYFFSKSSTGAITIGNCDEEKGNNNDIPDIVITR